MSRILRVKFKGATYHIYSRGDHKEYIFKDRHSADFFLKKLGEGSELYGVRVFAYCVMDNHYHLEIQTIEANISEFMHYLGSAFANYLVSQGWVGHVFAGRFHSSCVGDERYFQGLNRYIHFNPVKAGLAKRPEDYGLSSYRAYIGACTKPAWLDIDTQLEQFGQNRDIALGAYRSFVLSNRNHELGIRKERSLARAILEDEGRFIEIRMMLTGDKEPEGISAEQVIKARILYRILEETLVLFGLQDLHAEPWEVDIDQRIFMNARKTFIYLARRYANASYREIADAVGDMDASLACYHYHRMGEVDPLVEASVREFSGGLKP